MASCCGQTAIGPLTDRHRVRLRYRGGRPVAITGPVTRQQYRFSGKEREQLVDPRDAATIASSGAFDVIGLEELSTQEHSDG